MGRVESGAGGESGRGALVDSGSGSGGVGGFGGGAGLSDVTHTTETRRTHLQSRVGETFGSWRE